MTKKIASYGFGAGQTFGPIANLLNGGVQVIGWGAPGGGAETAFMGYGGKVIATIAMSTSDTLTLNVGGAGGTSGTDGGTGYKNGGNSGSTVETVVSGGGGAATGISKNGTIYVIAGGGGGGAGGAKGGNGGINPQPGQNGNTGASPGHGGGAPTPTADGAAGAGFGGGSNGTAGSSGTGGNGGAGPGSGCDGGGGGGGVKGGGGGGGSNGTGGAGAGGLSWVSSSVDISNVSYVDGINKGFGLAQVKYTVADAPLAPIPTSPGLGSIVNLASGSTTFIWDYEPGTGDTGSAQYAFAFRIKAVGSSTYNWWNGSSFVGTETYIVSSTPSVTISNSLLGTNGNSYNWSVATKENGIYQLAGPYCFDEVFAAAAVPVLTPVVAYPTIPNPVVTWTETIAGTQSTFRGVVYTLAQTLASGFTPGGGSPVFDTGNMSSANQFFTITTALNNLETYVAYVIITQSTGGLSSAWTSVTFTMEMDGPVPPNVMAVADTDPNTGCPIVDLTAVCEENLLTGDQASFETSSASYSGSTATVAQDTTEALDGSHSLKVTVTGAAAYAQTPILALATLGLGGTALTPGVDKLGAVASVFPSAAAIALPLTVKLQFNWYNGSNSLLGTTNLTTAVSMTLAQWYELGLEQGNNIGSANGAVIPATVGGQTPVGVRIIFLSDSTTSGQNYWIDNVGLYTGSGASALALGNLSWSPGGLAGTEVVTFYRVVQFPEENIAPQQTLLPVRFGQNIPIAQGCIDYEAPFGIALQYIAIASVTNNGQQVFSPLYGTETTNDDATYVAPTLTTDQYWVIDPLDPTFDLDTDTGSFTTGAVPVLRTSSRIGSTASGIRLSHEVDQIEQQGSFNPFGRANTTLVRGDLYNENFDFAFFFAAMDDWENFDALRKRRVTVCMRSDIPGKLHYMAFGPNRPRDMYSGVDRTTPQSMSECIMQCIPQDVP